MRRGGVRFAIRAAENTVNRRIATVALALTLVAPATIAAGEEREAGTAYYATGPSSQRPVTRIVRAPAAEPRSRVIVEFVLPPRASSGASSRDSGAHRELARRLEADLSALDGAASTGKRATSTVDHSFGLLFSGAAVTTSPANVDAISRLGYVKRVVADASVRASLEPGVQAVGADRAWASFGTRGTGVTVAVVDSGIDYTHPALGGGIGAGFRIVGGHDFVNDDDDPWDDNGHGTHVAGIVAASSDDVVGVAPDATLLAYKVLDAGLNGLESDVIAALERAADPDGDGDPSDRAHVVNLSLGGDGTPDDPQSLAVNAAADLGIVVVVAAGNEGRWSSIQSPGTAANAITVGAVDGDDAVAEFSSRGPVEPGYGSKPDLVAPGVAIRSTWPGGTSATLSGTSMAAPHVAGIAALVRAVHPAWSSEQVRSAIVNSARPIGAAVMEGGAGFPDAENAAGARSLAEPAAIEFGIVESTSLRWGSRRIVRLRNASEDVRSYSVRTTGARDGLTVSVSALTFTLQPAEEYELEVTVRVDNGKLDYPDDGSRAFDGTVVLESTGETISIPWAVIRGHALHLEWSGAEEVVALLGPAGEPARRLRATSEAKFDAIVTPGAHDLHVVATPADGGAPYFVSWENLFIDADRSIVASRESAPFTIAFVALDEAGRPLASAERSPTGCLHERAIVLPGAGAPIIDLVGGGSPDVRTSSFSAQISILGAELCVEGDGLRIYSMSYEPVRGASASTARRAGGGELLEQPVALRVPVAGAAGASLTFESLFKLDGLPLPVGMTRSLAWSEPLWNGTLLLGRRSAPMLDFPLRAVAAGIAEREVERVASPLILRNGDGVTCFDGAAPAPTAYAGRAGEPLSLGIGALLPIVTVSGETSGQATLVLLGPLDETISSATQSISLFSRRGELIATDRAQVAIPGFDAKPQIVAHAEVQQIGAPPVVAKSSLTTGAAPADPLPPALTSFLFVGSGGARIVDRAPKGSQPRVRFSALDGVDRIPKARVRFRQNRTIPWSDAPVTLVGEDTPAIGLGRPPRGAIYEAALDQLASSAGRYDLEIVLEDVAGNITTTTIEPAIEITEGRRRPARP